MLKSKVFKNYDFILPRKSDLLETHDFFNRNYRIIAFNYNLTSLISCAI